jgi:sugar phosphate isomerase/epimerase
MQPPAFGPESLYRFHLGATSYVYPGDLVHNVERLAGQVQDVELILFELATGESNLPTPTEVGRLAALAAAHDITYTVHLPLDLRHGGAGDPAQEHPSLRMAARVMGMTAPLTPHAYVFHLDGAGVDEPGWTERAVRAVSSLLDRGAAPQQLALENLESYPPEALLPVFAALPITRTLDVGHLWRAGRDPLPVLDAWLPHASVVHLHAMAEVDHRSLALAAPDQLDPVVERLLNWGGVLTLEVFEDDFFTSRAALLTSVERCRAIGSVTLVA